MIRQYELVDRVTAYNPQADEALLNKAYVFGIKVHGGQKRHSGDPYFSHPLEVAAILTDLRLDTATIVTALLHDTIEDTAATRAEIAANFGEEIAELVDGVTKLSRLDFASEHVKQAENFRKLLIAMSNDIRVLLVKLADRLHNMRTLRHMPKAESRLRVATETMDIYAPLAGRIGMQEIREELEDLAFAEINPEARASIETRLTALRAAGGGLKARMEAALREVLSDAGVHVEVEGREKKPFSIWRKMQVKHQPFGDMSDVLGFRVIVDTTEACYRALGVLHQSFPMVPGRFKDYISTPKRNGYRSIHTTVIGPSGLRIEMQVRTAEMHQLAERGVAAHWSYKEQTGERGGPASNRVRDLDRSAYAWLRGLVDILEQGATSEEFLEHTKLEMFHDQVFCFTPKGDLIGLPRGATPIDFAYAVHSRIGDTCVGARINGRAAPLRTQLQNGDQVEVVCSSGQEPSAAWEALVVTGRARAGIRRARRQRDRETFVKLGESAVRRGFKAAKLEATAIAVWEAAKRLGLQRVNELYERVGRGQLSGDDAVGAAFPDAPAASGRTPPLAGPIEAGLGPAGVTGLPADLEARLAECCTPIPGDRIVGVRDGKGMAAVHVIDCVRLAELQDDQWIDLGWEADGAATARRRASLRVDVVNEPGSLGAVATTIARAGANISNIAFRQRSQDFITILIEVEVRDLRHLLAIVAGLRATEAVATVERTRGEHGDIERAA